MWAEERRASPLYALMPPKGRENEANVAIVHTGLHTVSCSTTASLRRQSTIEKPDKMLDLLFDRAPMPSLHKTSQAMTSQQFRVLTLTAVALL